MMELMTTIQLMRIASKNSGTYTYSAAGINGAATGAGSGTLDASVVIDFAAKTILRMYQER